MSISALCLDSLNEASHSLFLVLRQLPTVTEKLLNKTHQQCQAGVQADVTTVGTNMFCGWRNYMHQGFLLIHDGVLSTKNPGSPILYPPYCQRYLLALAKRCRERAIKRIRIGTKVQHQRSWQRQHSASAVAPAMHAPGECRHHSVGAGPPGGRSRDFPGA